jgi:predicted metalloprotease with PDZ domain
VIAVDGTRVNAATVGKRLADGVPGQEVAVTLFRRDRLRAAKVRLVRNPERKWTFTAGPEASPRKRRLRGRWLGVTG